MCMSKCACVCVHGAFAFHSPVYLSLSFALVSVHVVVYCTNKLKSDLTHTFRSLSLAISLSRSVSACQFFSCFYVAVLRLLMLMLPMLYVLKSVCILFLSVKTKCAGGCVSALKIPNDLSIKTHTRRDIYAFTQTQQQHLLVSVFLLRFQIQESLGVYKSVVSFCKQFLKHIFTAKKAKYKNSTHIHMHALTHAHTHSENNQNVCKKRMGTIENEDDDDTKKTVWANTQQHAYQKIKYIYKLLMKRATSSSTSKYSLRVC